MKVEFYILTIFPEIVRCYTRYGIVRQAIKKKLVKVEAIDLREFAPKGQVDDIAYGGLPGMVLKPEPILSAYEHIVNNYGKAYVLITEPWGRKLEQDFLRELSSRRRIIIVCGRYEGVDERVKAIVDEEVSLGDFVLSGGELVALALVDGTTRLLEGVLSEPRSLEEDSFQNRWLGYPVYTRPRKYKGMEVPQVLLSGNHKLIELWKLWHRIENTVRKRPDLIPKDLTPEEREILENIKKGVSFEEWVKGLSSSS